MKLVIEQIRTGYVVRPVNSVGTMGWNPKPWSAQFFRRRLYVEDYFLVATRCFYLFSF